MRKVILASIVLLLCSFTVRAQQALNNDAIVKLAKAGLSDELIVSTISSKSGAYDTTPDGLIALKAAGVSDKVVAAIVAKDASSGPVAAAPAAAQPASPDPAPAAQESQAASPAANPDPGNKNSSVPIQPGARIVIAPMGGFETYFAAAVREKGVPVTLTLDKNSAQFFIVSTETEWRGFIAGSAAGADVNQAGGHFWSGSAASSTRGLESSIMLIDAKSKDVVWAYEVHKSSHGALIFGTQAARGQQSLAEACAKHLKEFIVKGR